MRAVMYRNIILYRPSPYFRIFSAAIVKKKKKVALDMHYSEIEALESVEVSS